MTVSETFHPALRVFQPAWNDMGIPLRGELFYLERKCKRCGSVLWLKIFIEVCDLRFKPRVIQACILFQIARACVNIYKIGPPILCSFPIDFELDMHKIELE